MRAENAAVTVSVPKLPHILLLVLASSFLMSGVVATIRTPDGIRLEGTDIRLELAATPAARALGLSGRQSLAGNEGMLFSYETPGTYCFWMKDTFVALDMIWLDKDKRIIHIEQDVLPSSYPAQFCPPDSALHIIELKAGTAKELHLHTGQTLDF